jgi:septal ring factor EnvC (AmiA/AmiB activator)
MSDDNTERQMAFIIEQQARYSADIAEVKERMLQLTSNMERMANNISRITDALLSLTNIVERHDQRTTANEAQIAALVEQSKETGARLNALIEMVERHISGHN